MIIRLVESRPDALHDALYSAPRDVVQGLISNPDRAQALATIKNLPLAEKGDVDCILNLTWDIESAWNEFAEDFKLYVDLEGQWDAA